MSSPDTGAVAPQEPASFGDNLAGMFNVFVDPASTAKRVGRPWFWVPPFIIVSIITVVVSIFISPIAMDVMRKYPPSEQLTGEALDRAVNMAGIISKVQAFAAPLLFAIVTAISAWIVSLMCSMLSMKARFMELFSLITTCSLITAIGSIAGYFVIRAKADDITSMQQLAPSFGLDIFFPDLKGPLFALLNYFSLFQIWYLVVLALGLAYLTRSSKGKGFMAITPLWVIGLAFRLLGSLFSK